jgi:hypothetical protein
MRQRLEGSSRFEAENRERIRQWLLGALLNNVFGGNSDQTIGVSRALIREELALGENFPIEALSAGLFQRRGRVVTFDDNNTAGLLDIRYGHRTCFLGLSVLYDEQHWGVSLYHIDHIIPRSLVSVRALEELGLSAERIETVLAAVDRLGNLQLLPARENQEKSNQEFDAWIRTRDPGFLRRHLIPPDAALWSVEHLPEFVAARDQLIRERLKSVILAMRGGGPTELGK